MPSEPRAPAGLPGQEPGVELKDRLSFPGRFLTIQVPEVEKRFSVRVVQAGYLQGCDQPGNP